MPAARTQRRPRRPCRSSGSAISRSSSVVALCLVLSACGRDATPVRVVDLLREVPGAEMRPARTAFQVVDYGTVADPRPSLVTDAPSRIIFTLPIPRRATFVAQVALGTMPADGATPAAPLGFRVGISDERIYEVLANVQLTPGTEPRWTELRADLSGYAGWQWSLFYRPEQRRWRLILSTDAVSGVAGRAVWGAPAIYADRWAGREYVQRARKSAN